MECSCGGIGIDRKVVRHKAPAGEYTECTSCGRILWRWKTKALEKELKESQKSGIAPTDT